MIRTFTLAAIAVFATSAFAQAPNSSSVSLGDEYFVMKAYADGIAQVAQSQLAVTRATQADIRAFAERMIREHTECDNKLVEVARKTGIALPATIDAVHSAVINRLGRMSGSDFDKAYLKAEMGAHVAETHLFEHASCKGEDSEIKDLATNTLPTLKDHAKSAFELAGERAEYQKFCKINDYAKQVMSEK